MYKSKIVEELIWWLKIFTLIIPFSYVIALLLVKLCLVLGL
jgi:hypothetical protein